MNVTLNTLPVKTWNRLHMNDATVNLEAPFVPHAPSVEYSGEEKVWKPGCGGESPAPVCGFHPDFTALTAIAQRDLVETAPDAAMSAPIVLNYTYEAGEHGASRLLLHAAGHSTLSAVVFLSSPAGACESALQVELRADEGAALNLYVVQLMGPESLVLTEIGGRAASDASVHLVRMELGGQKVYSGASLDLAGKNAAFTADIGAHVRAGQLMDMNYVAEHRGKNTETLITVSDTLEENSRKLFRGTIDFKQGAAGAKGTENENVLLLGEHLVNQTIPLILCQEEDVEGNHGASIGQLDERMLFYLASRGISQQEACRMIARARIQAVCDLIPCDKIRDKIQEFEENQE